MTAQDDSPRNKDEMIARIDRSWSELDQVVAGLSQEQLTGPRDAAGWSVKDHLAHLTAWERMMLLLVRDRVPAYRGLGIDQALSESGDFDAENAAIDAKTKDQPWAEVEAERQQVHREMRALLEALPEEDLRKPYSAYIAGGPDRPVYEWVNGNTWGHFEEHRGWIEELVRGAE